MRNMEAGLRGQDAEAPDLAEAAGRLGRASLLVVGDAMLDRYVYGRLRQGADDAPFPVLEVERELALPGGAANLVRRLTALGAAVSFVSVVGDDQTGSDLTGLIGGQPGVEPWLLVEGGRATTLRTRFLADGHPVLRADQEETGPIQPKLAERLLRFARDAMLATAVTVLSDHAKGVLAENMPAQLIGAARQCGRPVVAVPRAADYARYAGAEVLVVPCRELPMADRPSLDNPAEAAEAARRLREQHGFGAVALLGGAGGLTLADTEGAYHCPAVATPPSHAAEAADAVVATLAAGLAAGLGLRVAARLASVADVTAARPATTLEGLPAEVLAV